MILTLSRFATARRSYENEYPNAKLCLMLEAPNTASGVDPEGSAPIATFFSGGAGWAEAEDRITRRGFSASVLAIFDTIEEAQQWSIARGGHAFTGGEL